MWTIYNKTTDKYWNSDNKEWTTILESTRYDSYVKVEKEIKNTISTPSSIIMVKPISN